MTDQTEFELLSGEWSAVVSSRGASLRTLDFAGQPVVAGYRGTENKQGGQGDVLIPFPGRVSGGRYRWDGLDYQMALTDKDGPNAIHGFVRTVDWDVVSRSLAAVAFSLRFPGAPGYPFPLTVRIEYSLDANGLQVDCSITNSGSHDAPIAMGFHPYFTVGSSVIDTDTLTLPFNEVLEFERLIPTGRVLPVEEAGLDFRAGRVIGDTKFNHCFTAPTRGADGLVRVRLNYGLRAFAVWMDESFDYVVIYTGDALPPGVARSSIAIEPMSSATDALNHQEWGLRRLPVGSTHLAQWGVTFG
jgi:aldose 1-epimerase